jgi:hypothetical protein
MVVNIVDAGAFCSTVSACKWQIISLLIGMALDVDAGLTFHRCETVGMHGSA